MPSASRRLQSDKHQAVLAAAVRLFARYGYRRTSIDDVAREAEVAKGTVYLSFDSKDALFQAACSHVAQQFLDAAQLAAERGGPLLERVQALLEAKFVYLFELVHASPHARELIDSKNALSSAAWARFTRAYEEQLAGVLADADRRGELRLESAGVSAAAAAALLVRSAHGASLSDAHGSVPSAAVHKRRLTELTRVLLKGFGARLR